MNNQHHACILEANYYLSAYNVHFKLAYLKNRKIFSRKNILNDWIYIMWLLVTGKPGEQ